MTEGHRSTTVLNRSLLSAADVEVVDAESFVSIAEAQRELGLRTRVGVNTRVRDGYLVRAATHPGPWSAREIGITRGSLNAEVRRSAAESRRGRWSRRFGYLLRSF